jgi:hypothetical protein
LVSVPELEGGCGVRELPVKLKSWNLKQGYSYKSKIADPHIKYEIQKHFYSKLTLCSCAVFL